MKNRIFLTLLLAILSISLNAQTDIDRDRDSLTHILDKQIYNYLSTIPAHPDSLIGASDILIKAGSGNQLSAYIAARLFTIFKHPSAMGLEKVAIHIAQNYFINNRLTPPPGLELSEIVLYTQFNKNSLIGMKAPDLQMTDDKGEAISLHHNLFYRTILLFFDDDCNICIEEVPKVMKLADSLKGSGVGIFAVYTQEGRYEGNMPDNCLIAYDPEFISDYQRLYNVVKTPQIFLIDKKGVIIGRNLGYSSLKELIQQVTLREREEKNETYRVASAFMESVNYDDTVNVKDSYSSLFNKLTSVEEFDLYREIFSFIYEELLYSLNEDRKEASIIVARNFITPYPHLWPVKEYPEQWVPSMVKRTIANRVGAGITPVKASDPKGKRVKIGSKKNRYTLIYFSDNECFACKEYSELLNKELKDIKKRDLEVIVVNPLSVDPLLFQTEKIPHTLLLNKSGVIVAKNINPQDIKSLIK